MRRAKRMGFSKNDTLAVKGIAIIIMFFHHCFLSPVRFEGYDVSFAPFPQDYVVAVSAFGKICVGMFVFLSAYGMTIAIKNKFPQYNFGKREMVALMAKRYISLMSGFIVAFFIAVAACAVFNPPLLDIYKDGMNGAVTFVIDLLGLAEAFHTNSLVGTWWYMSVAITLIFVLPLALRCYKRLGLLLLPLAVLLPRLFFVQEDVLNRYVICVVIGIWFADSNLLARIKGWHLCGNWFLSKTIKCIAGIFLIVSGIVLRLTAADIIGYDIIDSVWPVIVICFCNEFIIPVAGVRQVLMFLGRHSMNMFLLHTFIRQKLFRDFTYSFHSAWIILIVLLADSLLLSIVVEAVKNICRYPDLISKLQKAVHKKIMGEQ